MQVISRTLAALEAVVILLPLTLLSFYPAGGVGVFMVGLPALLCGWSLIVAFVRSGRDGLADRSLWWWALPAITGLAAAAGLWALLVDMPDGPLRRVLGLFGLGWPALIPLLHLAVERWLVSGTQRA